MAAVAREGGENAATPRPPASFRLARVTTALMRPESRSAATTTPARNQHKRGHVHIHAWHVRPMPACCSCSSAADAATSVALASVGAAFLLQQSGLLLLGLLIGKPRVPICLTHQHPNAANVEERQAEPGAAQRLLTQPFHLYHAR
eukprot:GHVU01103950.1.p1 GENE.GHVU01103950.1~~GHVU01103950.1.p1  ORF type:complete len:146 (-),score=12.38 GHVU01103950.1:245-682(-)